MTNIRKFERFEGQVGFYLMWFGQFISILASRMTSFAITLWAWDLTGSATALVLVGFTTMIPYIVLSPIAGTLVDRWNRKMIMVLSDTASALSTTVLLYLFVSNQIEIWHLYVVGAFAGIFGSFQYPAFAAVVTTMVPKKHYARANSIPSIVGSASGIGGPLLAGALISQIKISGIMIIDLVTFFIAIALLVFVVIPQPEHSEEVEEGKRSVWQETVFGFKYVFARPSLAAFLLMFTFGNIGSGFVRAMANPMVLAKTGNDAASLGMTNAAGAFGILAGGLIVSIWSGPKKRIHIINISRILRGLLITSILGTAWILPNFLVGFFFMGFFLPIINGNFMAILQAKVAPDMQGRIFGVDSFLSLIVFPFAQLAAGVLTDNIFEPAMAVESALSTSFGWLVGTGPGAGFGLMIVIGGIIALLSGLVGYVVPRIREIETLLPDHESILED